MPDRPQHARTQSQGRKLLPPHARPSKAPSLRRGTSYNHSRPQSHGQDHHSHSKSGAGWSKKAGGGEEEAQYIEDEESGMASFLQFCATCEKQIFTPGASILYCSEHCRRKDVSRPPSIQSIEAVRSPSIVSQNASYFDHHDIVPQRSPTVLRPVSLAFSDLSLSDYNTSEDKVDTLEQGHNDSSRYLEQFYSDFSSSNYASGARRSRTTRASTATDSSNLPSLVHSPSSSYGTIASNASYRPLPPRHNPFSTTHCSTKSIDLVLPYDTTTHNHNEPSISPTTQLLKDSSLKSSASTLTSFRVAEANDITYDKRTPQASRTGSAKSEKKADQSLKQLFSHEAMKAPPRQ